MTDAQFSLIVIAIIAVASNIFWAWNSHTLINKLMSRNFYEYKEASVTTDKPKTKNKVVPDLFVDDLGSMSEYPI